MKHVFPLILLLLLLSAVTGCSALSPSTESLEIRVANRSQSDFQNVIVRFPSQEVDYGALGSGIASSYEVVGEAYRYASIEVLVDGERRLLHPIDYVGETLLSEGRYTYALGIDRVEGRLTLKLEED